MLQARIIALIGASLALGGTAALAGSPFENVLLAEHNRARSEVGVPALQWSDELAADARDWAEELADSGVMAHADHTRRRGAGENLWAGASGHYDAQDMVALFVAERRHYRHAAFPDVSTTGRWSDVGHYTQIVWRDTREVGCAIARGEQDEFLVCRYWPAGNYMGQLAY